jgi:uncharacterized protein YjaZ
MAKIKLHVANAGDIFSVEEIARMQAAANTAESYLINKIGFEYDVDLIITPPSQLMSTIPEDGITGRTYSSRLIVIVLDKNQAEVSQEAVFETICHEMSHSIRWEKLPEYANTLFEGMILEGLGVALEEKALADNGISSKQFFLQTVLETSPEMIEDTVSKLKNHFDNTNYDYEKIFYTGGEDLPRWAGYRLGYYFVKEHLEKSGISITEATTASYKDFSY